ncbi:tumor protein D53 [Capricornis sumatraensis]|uniref:tumor protein D53 n=1 Tax=Capricornis sumatraensis TaxID=34865 RepID=UPI0036046654
MYVTWLDVVRIGLNSSCAFSEARCEAHGGAGKMCKPEQTHSAALFLTMQRHKLPFSGFTKETIWSHPIPVVSALFTDDSGLYYVVNQRRGTYPIPNITGAALYVPKHSGIFHSAGYSHMQFVKIEKQGADIPSLLETEPLQGRDEDAIASADSPSTLSEEEKEELKAELVQLEDEITTLRQVLSAKERRLVEIKQKLGMNLMNELKQNFSRGWHDVQTTTAYKKTHETLSHAGQKATAAFSNVGTAISKKFGDMRSHSIGYSIRHSISMPAMRNSPTFKSFEERVETTVTSLKTKVGGANHGGGSFEEVLSSTAHASSQSSAGGPRLAEGEELQC